MSEYSSGSPTRTDTDTDPDPDQFTKSTTLSLGTDAMIAADASTIVITAPSGHSALVETPTQNAGQDIQSRSNEPSENISIADSTTAPITDIALDGYVFALSGTTVQASTSSGVELWSTTVPAAQSLTTLNADGVLVCLTETGMIIGLDAETGTELFSADRPHAEVSEPQAIRGGEGYLAIGAWSFLTVFDSSGNCILTKNLDGAISDLAVLSDAIVVTLQHGNMLRVSYSDGDIEWSQQTTVNDIAGTATASAYAITDNHVTHIDDVGRTDPIIDAGGDRLTATADATTLLRSDEGTQSVYQQQITGEPEVTATLLNDTLSSDDSVRFQIQNTGTTEISGNIKIQSPAAALTFESPTPATVALAPTETTTVTAPVHELSSDSMAQSMTVDLFIDKLNAVSEAVTITRSSSPAESTENNSGTNNTASSSDHRHDTDTDTAVDDVEKSIEGSQSQDAQIDTTETDTAGDTDVTSMDMTAASTVSADAIDCESTQNSLASSRTESSSESSTNTDTQTESFSANARSSAERVNEEENTAPTGTDHTTESSSSSQTGSGSGSVSGSTEAIDSATADTRDTKTATTAQSRLFDNIETSIAIETIKADCISICLTATNHMDAETTISIETAQTVIDPDETSTLQTSIAYPFSDEMNNKTGQPSSSSPVTPTLTATVANKTEERSLLPDLPLERPSIDITPTGSVTTPFIDIILSIPFDARFTDTFSVMIGDTEFHREITTESAMEFRFALPISTAAVTAGTMIEITATLGSESDTSISHNTKIDATEWDDVDSDSEHAAELDATPSSVSANQEIVRPLSPLNDESEARTVSDSDEMANTDSSDSLIPETTTSDDHLQGIPTTTADESNKEPESSSHRQSNVTAGEQEVADAEQSASTDIEAKTKTNQNNDNQSDRDDRDSGTTHLDLSNAHNAGTDDLTSEDTQSQITAKSADKSGSGNEHSRKKDDVTDSGDTIDSDSQITSEQSTHHSTMSESPLECTRVVPDTVPYGHRFEESIVITNTGNQTIETASISLAETSLNLDAIDPGEQSTVTRTHAGFDPGSWELESGQVITPDVTVDIPPKSVDIHPSPKSDINTDTNQAAPSPADVDPFVSYVTLNNNIVQFECRNLGSDPCDLISLAVDPSSEAADAIQWPFDDPPVLDAGETTQFECGGGADTESLTPPFTARIRYRRVMPADDNESTLEHTTLAIPQTAAATGGDTPLSLSVQPQSQPIIDEHNTIACTLTTDASVTDVVVEATGDIVAPLSVGERSLGRLKDGRTNRQLFDITPQQGPTASFHVRVSATLDGSSFSQHYRVTGPVERSDSSNPDESAWQVVPVADTETAAAEAEAETETETTPPNVRVTTTPQVQSRSHR